MWPVEHGRNDGISHPGQLMQDWSFYLGSPAHLFLGYVTLEEVSCFMESKLRQHVKRSHDNMPSNQRETESSHVGELGNQTQLSFGKMAALVNILTTTL